PDPATLELVQDSGPGSPPWVRTLVVSALGVVVSLLVLPRVARWRTRRIRAADPVEQALRASGAMELGGDDAAPDERADRGAPTSTRPAPTRWVPAPPKAPRAAPPWRVRQRQRPSPTVGPWPTSPSSSPSCPRTRSSWASTPSAT